MHDLHDYSAHCGGKSVVKVGNEAFGLRTCKPVIRAYGTETEKGRIGLDTNWLAKVKHHASDIKCNEEFFPPKDIYMEL